MRRKLAKAMLPGARRFPPHAAASYRQPPRALPQGSTEPPAAAHAEPEPLHLLACPPAAPPCHWPAPAPPGSARLGAAVLYCAAEPGRGGRLPAEPEQRARLGPGSVPVRTLSLAELRAPLKSRYKIKY